MAAGSYQVENTEELVIGEPQMALPLDATLSDPSFTENRIIPIHRWTPWIAGFSSAFVHDCITTHLSERAGGVVLDPFAGVGTTLLTAKLRGLQAIGFEINPYAVLACRTKLGAVNVDLGKLTLTTERYQVLSSNGLRTSKGNSPKEFITRIPFFSPRIEAQVFGFLRFLEKIDDESVADIFRLAFGSVMVSFSNYTYEPSLCSRPGAGKPLIEDADVHATILAKLNSMREDIRQLQETAGASERAASWAVHEQSFMTALEVTLDGSIDLAITSPPYLNNYHYVRSTRPHLHWLGLLTARADFQQLEQDNVGKYWQTVRGGPQIELEFDDAGCKKLIKTIRETRVDKGPYGGPGWANYAASYLNDSNRFIQTLSKLLAPNGTAIIVIGNSIIQGHDIPVDRILGKMGQEAGLRLVGIPVLREKRTGASITQSTVRRGASSKASLYESAVILKKE